MMVDRNGSNPIPGSMQGTPGTLGATPPVTLPTQPTPAQQQIDLGVYDIRPEFVEIGEIQAEKLHSIQYGNKPVAVKNPDQMVSEVARRVQENGNCCVKILNLITHGSAANGIAFMNGTTDESSYVHLTTAEDADKYGGALKPLMCKKCQINLMGCFAGAGVFAKELAQKTGCHVLAYVQGDDRVGYKYTANGTKVPTWKNMSGNDITHFFPNGGNPATINGTSAGTGQWPNVIPN
jgi:hypothetical protein